MEVILLEKVRNLGNLGDKAKVKPGYARNYLFPFKKAAPANEANLAEFEARRAELEKLEAEHLAAAQKRAEALATVAVTIAAHSGDEGKLYGSVGVREIAEAVTAAGNELNKSEVCMPEGPIRVTGEYDIVVQLHTDVETTIKVTVVEDA